MTDALALFFAKKSQPAAGSATEAPLTRTRRIHHLTGSGKDGARLVIDVPVTAQIAGIVIDDVILRFWTVGLRQTVEVARQELAVVFDGRSVAVFPGMLPIVGRNRAHAMRADRDDFAYLASLQGIEVRFGELLEHQIVAQPPGRIACTLLFLQNAEGGFQVPHHLGEGGDDLAALRIVSAHA